VYLGCGAPAIIVNVQVLASDGLDTNCIVSALCSLLCPLWHVATVAEQLKPTTQHWQALYYGSRAVKANNTALASTTVAATP
jgi:hypothetical protein